MSYELLAQEEIDRALERELPRWSQQDDALVRTVEAPSFLEGIALVRRIGEVAEDLNHHPDIDIRYTKLTFSLSTHSAGGITMQDLRLAGDIDRLLP